MSKSKAVHALNSYEITTKDCFLDIDYLLFDAVSINKLVDLELQTEFLKELKNDCGVEFTYITPVKLEMSNTDNNSRRLLRWDVLAEFEFIDLFYKRDPLKLNKTTESIMKWMVANNHYNASPTDLYLGSALAEFGGGKQCLITENIRDFPLPLYSRVGTIVLNSEKSRNILSILSINQDLLEPYRT